MKALNVFPVFLGLALIAFPSQSKPQTDQTAPAVLHLKLNVNKAIISTWVDLEAGQEAHIRNDAFVWFRIWSDYPLVIHLGHCQATTTTDITCEIQPSQKIHFQDLRIGYPNDAPINRVRITALKHAP
jgi:hypothetical protein